MLFEKDKYYKLIKALENIITIIYVVVIFISASIGAVGGAGGLIIGILIGVLISYINTLIIKIKVQEMKFKMDLYDKVVRNKEI